jgi:hypothetical protein
MWSNAAVSLIPTTDARHWVQSGKKSHERAFSRNHFFDSSLDASDSAA